MIDLIPGIYVLVGWANLESYLTALGVQPVLRAQMLNGLFELEIFAPTNPENPRPGYYFFSEYFGGLKTEFVLDTSHPLEIFEPFGSSGSTLNTFCMHTEDIISQKKQSNTYRSLIVRNFTEHDLKVVLTTIATSELTYLHYQRS